MAKVRIKLGSIDIKSLNNVVEMIREITTRAGVVMRGPIPLPTEIRKYTVNRSTFVHKDAREQYEMRVHKRLIDILNPSAKVIDSLSNLNLPAGVDIEIKM